MIETSSTDNELLKCFDENGNMIAPKMRKEAHAKPYRIWHGVTAIWLINSKGQILCTRRSRKNEGNPGKWQTYVGGHG
jgi:isopentenyldiphosphate isomerase